MILLTLARARTLAIAVAAGATFLSLAVVTPAHADRAGDAPVTRDDRATVPGNPMEMPFNGRAVDVLANDRDPDGDELAICRVVVPDGVPLHVSIETAYESVPFFGPGAGATRSWSRAPGESGASRLSVSATTNRAGTYTLRYWACDFDYLTPATLTVTVTPAKTVRAKVLSGRHRVRFTNDLQRPVRLEYVVTSGEGGIERSLRIGPGRSTVIRAERRQLVWFARTLGRRSMPVGFGLIRGLRPRG